MHCEAEDTDNSEEKSSGEDKSLLSFRDQALEIYTSSSFRSGSEVMASIFGFDSGSAPLTSEDVAYGPPANLSPSSLALSPNGEIMTLLFPDHTGGRQLYQYLPSENQFKLFVTVSVSGELSHEEKLRRERMRLFTTGISSYSWGQRPNGLSARVLIPMNGQVVVYDPKYGEVVVVYDGSSGAAIDPSWSPDGNMIAFVANRDLFCLQIPGKSLITHYLILSLSLSLFRGDQQL
jgi:WD40 repeat protein